MTTEEWALAFGISVENERRYAFEWLDGFQEWDDVTCDA